MGLLPWEGYGNFVVVERFYDNVVGRNVLLAENPTRVAIHVSVETAGGHINLSIRPDCTADNGFHVEQNQQLPFRLTWHADGPIVCKKWFVVANGAVKFTVWETLLIRNPATGESSGVTQTVDPTTGNPIND